MKAIKSILIETIVYLTKHPRFRNIRVQTILAGDASWVVFFYFGFVLLCVNAKTNSVINSLSFSLEYTLSDKEGLHSMV